MSEHAVPSATESTEPDPRPVVVGVGPDEVDAALAFAAEEAIRAGCGLHLVHAVRVVPAGAEVPLLSFDDFDKWGREILARAVKRAEEFVDDRVPITHELGSGNPVHVLAGLGRTARMVVLEHRHMSRLARIVNRTTAGGVAAHLSVPVVAVPTGWTPSAGPRVVVAGVDVPERCEEVLAAAVVESRARDAGLRIVHSWALPVDYEGFPLEPDEHRRWTERSTAELRGALDRLGEEAVGIDAEVVIHPGRAIEAILECAKEAELLVIGRHDPRVPFGSHIGPVARAVLREATCPVLLASPHPRRGRRA